MPGLTSAAGCGSRPSLWCFCNPVVGGKSSLAKAKTCRCALQIAVAFFGIPRNSQICFPSNEQNVLAQFPAGSDVQCFYHLYKIDEVQNFRSGEKGELAADNYQPFESMIGALTSTDRVLERWDFEQ